MKKFAFFAVIMLFNGFFQSCQRDIPPIGDKINLYSEMNEQYEIIHANVEEYIYSITGINQVTRSTISDNKEILSSNIGEIPAEYNIESLKFGCKNI